jgi:hypothetical protein
VYCAKDRVPGGVQGWLSTPHTGQSRQMGRGDIPASFFPPSKWDPTGGERYPYIEPSPLESYACSPPEERQIFVSHGPTQTFDPLPLSPRHLARTPPPVVTPRPLSRLSRILSIPHLPPTPSQGSDGTEALQNNIVTGLASLVSVIPSAPEYLLDRDTSEQLPFAPFEDKFGLHGSTWPTLPLRDNILDWF